MKQLLLQPSVLSPTLHPHSLPSSFPPSSSSPFPPHQQSSLTSNQPQTPEKIFLPSCGIDCHPHGRSSNCGFSQEGFDLVAAVPNALNSSRDLSRGSFRCQLHDPTYSCCRCSARICPDFSTAVVHLAREKHLPGT